MPRRASEPSRAGLSPALIALAAAISLLPACGEAPTPALIAPAQTVRTVAGPISMFERSCASCHGAYGEFFEPLRREWTPEECKDVVGQMVRQRTSEKPTPAEMDALVAYVRSLRDQVPMIAITGRDHESIAGEVTPGCVVTVHSDGKALRAAVDGHLWSCPLPGAVRVTLIEARRADGTIARIADAGASAVGLGLKAD